MKGYVICQDTFCQGWVIDWITNEDGTESPDLYTDPREAARNIIEQRIDFLRSRLDNLDAMDEPDPDEASGEAGDDLDLFIEPATIEGEGATATIQLDCWDTPELLSEASRRMGRNDPVRWPPLDSPPSGEQTTPVPTQNGG